MIFLYILQAIFMVWFINITVSMVTVLTLWLLPRLISFIIYHDVDDFCLERLPEPIFPATKLIFCSAVCLILYIDFYKEYFPYFIVTLVTACLIQLHIFYLAIKLDIKNEEK